jgi:hypothetical protein
MTDIKIVSKEVGNYMGAHTTENPDEIWLNIMSIWDWTVKSSQPRATQDEIIDRFAKKLNAIFLQELVCIFKAQDKIRIKGGACNPYCRHEKLVDMMVTPDEWKEIRKFHKQKKIRVLEES